MESPSSDSRPCLFFLGISIDAATIEGLTHSPPLAHLRVPTNFTQLTATGRAVTQAIHLGFIVSRFPVLRLDSSHARLSLPGKLFNQALAYLPSSKSMTAVNPRVLLMYCGGSHSPQQFGSKQIKRRRRDTLLWLLASTLVSPAGHHTVRYLSSLRAVNKPF